MGFSPVNVYPPSVVTAVGDGGAVETVVLTGHSVNTDTVQKTVTLFGVVNVTAGTSATAIVVKVRRGSTTAGVEVGTAETTTAVATDDYSIPFACWDQPGEVAGATYCVTVTETAATADGTVNVASLAAIVSQ